MTKVKTSANVLSGVSDSELIARYLKEQNPDYFTVLYRRYGGKVFAKCISMLGDEALAHDAVQDIFVKVYLNLSRFNEKSSFSTWLYSISYNFCIDLIRKKKKIPVLLADDVSRIGDEAEIDIPDSVLLEMKHDRLEKVLAELPEGDRIILLMKYMDDMSIKDIAEFFQKTESAIKMQIMRAKQKAQTVYDDLYASDPIES
ncbi:MAG: RNA polymerase sigma factor [Lewinellaceae bacterium]|nr:RNA polymerase sigma factor [Saprospiraceae bacterium]MCB9332371.1 RNA polymerase sigma factor [Lewinellaceae bacterium]